MTSTLSLSRNRDTTDPNELKQERARLHAKARLEVDRARADDRELSDSEAQRVDGFMDQAENLTAQIAQIEGDEPDPTFSAGGDRDATLEAQAEALERRAGPKVPRPDPSGSDPGGRVSFQRDAAERHPDGPLRSPDGRGLTMAELFGKRSLDSGGFRSAQEFFHTIHNGLHHDKLQAASMGERTGADGGFLVPTQYSAMLIDGSLEGEVVRPLADVQPMDTNHMFVPVWDTVSDHGTDIGGFGGEWLAESATATDEKGRFKSIELDLHKLAIYCKASNELVADGFQFENRLMAALRQAIGWHLDDAFLNGSGAGQPVGVLNTDALVAVSRDSSNAIAYGDLTSIYARMHPASLRNAVWIANPTAVPELMAAFATDGNVGSNAPVLRETGNGSFTMFGRPVIFTEKLPQLGTQGDILFADLSKYLIGLRQQIVIERSIAPGWQEDESAFRIKVRADGQGKWHSAVTPKNGDSLSWAVTLAA